MVSALRLRGHPEGQPGPSVGSRAVRVTPDGAGGHGAPLSVRRLRSRVAPGHQHGGRAPLEAVPPGTSLGTGGTVVQHLSVARIAEALAVSRNTANSAVLAEGRRLLIDEPTRFDDVKVIGVDEHVWRHTRRGDKVRAAT